MNRTRLSLVLLVLGTTAATAPAQYYPGYPNFGPQSPMNGGFRALRGAGGAGGAPGDPDGVGRGLRGGAAAGRQRLQHAAGDAGSADRASLCTTDLGRHRLHGSVGQEGAGAGPAR